MLLNTGLTSLFLLAGLSSLVYSQQPNIVFLLADDLGYNDIGYHNPDILTPNIDLLASQGVILEQSYVQPMCTPTRSALLTGTYPFRIGRQGRPLEINTPTGLTLEKKLLPQFLQDKGYATHMIGKWHLGFCKPEYLPTRRGFETHYGYRIGAEDYYTKMNGQGYDFYDGEEADFDAAGIYSTDLYTTRANSIIKTHANEFSDKPLFLYLAYQATHTPLEAPQRFQDMNSHINDPVRMLFSAAASALDESVMNITQTLKDVGLYENTLIVFMSDNGGLPGKHGGNNFPLRGMKGTDWEGGVRTPAFLHSPLLEATGLTVDHLIHVTDWLPTFMKASGFTDEEIAEVAMDGVDQWEMIKDPENIVSRREDVVLNINDAPQGNHIPQGAYRKGDYKLVVNPNEDGWIEPPTGSDESAEEDRPIEHQIQPAQITYLFNIVEDPEEREDLSAILPDILEELTHEFTRLHDEEMVPADEPEYGSGGLQDGVWVTGWC